MVYSGDRLPPIRIVTRGLAELQTSIMACALPLFDGSIDRFAIFTLLSGMRLRAGPGEARGISVLAIAASLSKPFETVRRNVRKMEAQGLCRQGSAGVVLAEEAMTQSGFATLLTLSHDCLVRFVEQMILLEAAPVPRRAAVPYHWTAGLMAAADLMLAVADGNGDAHRDFADLVIFSAILACNYRTITMSQALSREVRNETHLVPSDLLCGATPAMIARALALPESTVRRRMTALLGGPLELRDRAFFVAKPWFNSEAAIAVSRTSVARMRRMLNTIAQAGFPIDAPHTAYLGGNRPPYVSFA